MVTRGASLMWAQALILSAILARAAMQVLGQVLKQGLGSGPLQGLVQVHLHSQSHKRSNVEDILLDHFLGKPLQASLMTPNLFVTVIRFKSTCTPAKLQCKICVTERSCQQGIPMPMLQKVAHLIMKYSCCTCTLRQYTAPCCHRLALLGTAIAAVVKSTHSDLHLIGESYQPGTTVQLCSEQNSKRFRCSKQL